MKISPSMHRAQLAALMGPTATPDNAASMRGALLGADHADTEHVSRSDWLALLDLAVAGDAAVHAADGAVAECVTQAGVVVRWASDALNV